VAELKVAGRQPRGWEQIVNRLATASSRADFDQQILELQCRIIAAQYGVLWRRTDKALQPVAYWPASLGQSGMDPRVLAGLSQAAGAGFERGISRVMSFRINNTSSEAGNSYVFVTVMRRQGRVEAVSTAVAECMDVQAITNATVVQRELAAGLYDGYSARLEAMAAAEQTRHVRQALAVLASAQEATGFRGACMNLVNELATTLQAQRVSLGWVRGSSVRLIAMNDVDHVKRHTREAGLLEMAMAECLDQEQPLVWPVPEDAEPLLTQAVTYSHRKLLEGRADVRVLSVPVRAGEDVVGVLTVERTEQAFDPALVQRLQLTADVVGPQLRDRYQSDRWLIGHAWQSLRRLAAYLVGPKHVGWKLATLVMLAVLTYGLVGTWPYRISAPFRLEAHDRRVASAVYEGRLDRVHVQPGDIVKAGQLLAELDASTWRSYLAEANAELRAAQIQRDRASLENKQPEAAQAAASIEQIQARIALLHERIESTAIRSPIDGVVLAGYWHDKIGSMVEQGRAMFEIAPLEQLTAVVRVNEIDVNQITALSNQTLQPQITGELATRAEPRITFRIVSDRLVPSARPDDGANVFELWCTLEDPAPWLRPGMEGTARLDVGRRPIVWILTHRIVDTLRLWLWW